MIAGLVPARHNPSVLGAVEEIASTVSRFVCFTLATHVFAPRRSWRFCDGSRSWRWRSVKGGSLALVLIRFKLLSLWMLFTALSARCNALLHLNQTQLVSKVIRSCLRRIIKSRSCCAKKCERSKDVQDT